MGEIPTFEELQELLDNRLEGDRLREIEDYLAHDATMGELVQRLRQTDEELRQLDPTLLSRAPANRDEAEVWFIAPRSDAAPEPPRD